MIKKIAFALILSLSLTGFEAHAAKGVNTLVVSCIDFRLRTELENYAVERFGPDSYDEIAIAGASLGAYSEQLPGWNQTFVANLDIAIALHGVNTVVFIDHRDCGAYKKFVGPDCCTDREKETQAHETHMNVVRAYMKNKYPSIKVETLLMNLDGSVESLGPKAVSGKMKKIGKSQPNMKKSLQ